MSGHALIAPSSLATTVECNASVQIAAPYADAPRTDEQLEGDSAHWVALKYGDDPNFAMPVGTMTPQGILVDLDMIQGAELWRDTVGLYGIAETPVMIPRIHEQHAWGTPDRWRHDAIEGWLRVWDYKYGHRFVDVFENWQLMAYAAGLVDMLGLNDLETNLELVIVQPRAYHRDGPVRRWKIKAHELRGYMNRARSAAERALGKDPPAKTGEWCLDCPGRHECVALQRSAMAIADYSMTMDRVALPPAALGAELTIVRESIKRLEARETGLAAQAESAIRGGRRVPGFGLEAGQPRLKWGDAAEKTAYDVPTVLAMADAMGVNLRKDPEPITPTQAKKLKKVDESVIDAISFRPPAAMKLVAESTDATRKIFGAITT